MVRQKPISKKSKTKSDMKTFKSTKAMDHMLDSSELEEMFITSGIVKEPKIRKVTLICPSVF